MIRLFPSVLIDEITGFMSLGDWSNSGDGVARQKAPIPPRQIVPFSIFPMERK